MSELIGVYEGSDMRGGQMTHPTENGGGVEGVGGQENKANSTEGENQNEYNIFQETVPNSKVVPKITSSISANSRKVNNIGGK